MGDASEANLNYFFEPPDRLPPGYLDIIVALVEAGGSVKSEWVRYNLERAFLLAYVKDAEEIVACSSLKHPRPEYIETVKQQCGVDLSGFLERGYTSVKPAYRGMGIATKLLAGLTARIGDRKLYSVIGEDNIGGQKIARNNDTRRVAVYTSRLTGKTVGIWIPSWMIEPSP
jgi:GNAT superfamily N-acetyltransferase